MVEDNADLAQTVLDRLKIDGHARIGRHPWGLRGIIWRLRNMMLIFLISCCPMATDVIFYRNSGQKHATPVIVMTARSAISDRVALLDTGADDYITKPFDFTELEARVRAVAAVKGRLSIFDQFLDLTYDPATATVSVSGDKPRIAQS